MKDHKITISALIAGIIILILLNIKTYSTSKTLEANLRIQIESEREHFEDDIQDLMNQNEDMDSILIHKFRYNYVR